MSPHRAAAACHTDLPPDRRHALRALAALALAGAAGSPRPATAAADVVLVLGDSLSAEYGLKRGSGWVALLAARLRERAMREGRQVVEVVNASISGETTAGGLTRLPALLDKHKPTVLVVALGANDALRGLDLAATEGNLTRMLRLARGAGSASVLAGMMLPPNYGRAYGERFAALFGSVAKAEGARLVPFLLAGFAEDLGYFQADRIHPTEKAQPLILDNVWPALQ